MVHPAARCPNVREAARLGDRIVLLSSRPGLDALDLGGPVRGESRAARLWAATWPKLLAPSAAPVLGLTTR